MITIITVGKKHDKGIAHALGDYEKRLKQSFSIKWEIISPSSKTHLQAPQEESLRILKRLKDDNYVILLDERGELIDSPAFSSLIQRPIEHSRSVIIIISGAYGTTDVVRKRADFVWSLSSLVFPHQLVRLMLVEQLYRAYTIRAGLPYHHL